MARDTENSNHRRFFGKRRERKFKCSSGFFTKMERNSTPKTVRKEYVPKKPLKFSAKRKINITKRMENIFFLEIFRLRRKSQKEKIEREKR